MFSAPLAHKGEVQRVVFKPSNEVFIIGYNEWSSLKSTNEFLSVYKFTLLKSWMGPEIHKPAGIITLPPPFSLTCLMASLIAFVLIVLPSATAPKSTMLTE